MSEREPRKRIPYEGRKSTLITDDLAFIENKSSGHARKILTSVENITIQLWIDKHYYDIWQHGGDSGKRDGIDLQTVEGLVKRSMKHLLFYSSLSKGFSFLNPELKIERPVRIVLQEEHKGSILNIVIETPL